MSSLPGSFDLPRRQPLSAQSAAAIRRAVEQGHWRESLPSERRLCELFQVSRPTIRTALQMLSREGLIVIHQGRRNRLLTPAGSPAVAPRRVVGLVSHEPLPQLAHTTRVGVTEMRTHLAEHGFATTELVCPRSGARLQRRRLEDFVRQNLPCCCVLLSVSHEVQEWFAGGGLPALVLGSCHTNVRLPSLDVDYRAVCRHAAGLFRSHGHRHVAFIVPHSRTAGELASEQGFREGCEAPGSSPALVPHLVRHNGTAAGLRLKLDGLFASRERPTALLVAKPSHTFGVLVYLLKRGWKVPGDISLISRDSDLLFDAEISHYRIEEPSFVHRLTRLVAQMVDQGHLRPEPSLIFPRYIAGTTLKPVR